MSKLNDDGTAGKFFTFPLPLLAFPYLNPKDALSDVTSYCCYTVGKRTMEAHGEDQDTVEEIIGRTKAPDNYNAESEDHRSLLLGAETLNVCIRSCVACLARANDAIEKVRKMEAAVGSSPLVFVGANLLWDCVADKISFRDFTVICAVNSVLGQATKPKVIRRTLLRARAAGFKTPEAYASYSKAREAEIEEEKGSRKKNWARLAPATSNKPRPMLTVDELRHTLDRLEKRGLIFRFQASPRCVYFSKDGSTLRKDVIEIVKQKESRNIPNRRKEEREIMKQVRLEAQSKRPF